MNKPPVLHERTAEQITRFVREPSHAVLLVGPHGIGKGYIALSLAAQLLGIEPNTLPHYPYMRVISPDKGTISIEAIRELRHFLQLKTTGSGTLRRIAILEHSDNLTTEAQNAFLKILEEPPLDTVLILTVTTPRALLATIVSRTQTVTIYPPRAETVETYFQMDRDKGAVDKALALSGGLPGLMQGLLDDDQEHPLVCGVTTAKSLLSQPLAERLAAIDGLSKQKEEASYTIEALLHIAHTGINQATKRNDQKRLRQWYRVLKEATETQSALAANANTKLALTSLALQL
ncbi:MAG TPA: AAA family ATPase [Candidatus Saccharimonadales bacterium]|nr:AAA family ATPase [Candidatus Saccharimonadales bacterium]